MLIERFFEVSQKIEFSTHDSRASSDICLSGKSLGLDLVGYLRGDLLGTVERKMGSLSITNVLSSPLLVWTPCSHREGDLECQTRFHDSDIG